MIEVHGLRKRVGERWVARGLDLVVEQGASVAIMGPSGSGKTTLLRILAGLEPADAGEILLAGRRADAQLPPHRRGIAFLFQSSALWPHLSVGENIAFPLAHLRRPVRQRRVQELLEAVGLPEAWRRDPAGLSGGEARRVALARALAARCPILLLDEPTSNLDARTRQRVLALIREESQANGTTTLLVSHDPAETEALAGRRLLLDDGILITPEDVALN